MTEPSTGRTSPRDHGRHRARGGPGRIASAVGVATVAAVAASSAICPAASAPGCAAPTAAAHPRCRCRCVSRAQPERRGADPRVRMPVDRRGQPARARSGWTTPARSCRRPTSRGPAGSPAGPRPGEAGPAVIAGHVDSREGPAVFFRLAELRARRRGARRPRRRHDGALHRVTARRPLPEGRVPDRGGLRADAGAELRLITCGGDVRPRRRAATATTSSSSPTPV